jgi:hypothetical protein
MSLGLKITIHLGNAAMASPEQVLDCITQLLRRNVRKEANYFLDKEGLLKPFASRNLYDENGNDVGRIVCRKEPVCNEK